MPLARPMVPPSEIASFASIVGVIPAHAAALADEPSEDDNCRKVKRFQSLESSAAGDAEVIWSPLSHRLLHQSQTSELAEFASLSAVVVKTDASTNVGDVAGRAAAVSSSSGADSLPIPVSSTGASSSRKWMFVAAAAIGTAIGIYWWRR